MTARDRSGDFGSEMTGQTDGRVERQGEHPAAAARRRQGKRGSDGAAPGPALAGYDEEFPVQQPCPLRSGR